MKKSDSKIDWSLARSLLAGTRSHARRRLAGGILFGKSLFDIKLKAGICGAGGDRRSKVQVGPLKKEERAWNALCRKELGISRQTANRYIGRYEKAAEFAKALPEAAEILFADSASLSSEEIETLAGFVEKLVDEMTKSALLIELGIAVELDDDEEQDSGAGNGDFQVSLEQEALIFFASLPRKIAAMRKAIAPFRDYGKYQIFLHKLPLDDGRDGMPSLLGIKEGLEAVLKEGLSEVISDVGEAIEAKMSGKPAKPGRKTPTRRRK